MNGREPGSDDDFSLAEREALAAWRAPEPPPGFATGVVRAFKTEAATRGAVAPHALQSLAVAAAALLLLGGFLSLRGWTAGQSDEGAYTPVPGFTAHDGGPGPEVTPEVRPETHSQVHPIHPTAPERGAQPGGRRS